jgi:hypothetical protein
MVTLFEVSAIIQTKIYKQTVVQLVTVSELQGYKHSHMAQKLKLKFVIVKTIASMNVDQLAE